MTLKLTTAYDTPGNFEFDSAKVEISGTVAKLLLEYGAVADFSEDFADDTDHTYDSAKAEFTGGLVRQKSQAPANSVVGITYTTVSDASWPSGITKTLNGSPTVTAGKLVCSGAQGAGYTNAAIGAVGAAGAIKVKYTPASTGAPPANGNVIGLKASGGGNNDRLLITHSPSGSPGTLRITLNNSTGTAIYTATTIGSNWNPTAGVEYELELNWDAAAGVIRLFINGTLHGTLSPGAWTRGTNANRLIVGADSIIYNTANGSFADAVVFSTVQHTTGYTAGYTLAEELYQEALITLPVFTYAGPGLLKVAGIPTTTEAGSPRYIIQGFYWDGAAWSVSDDTYAQATSKADILTNIGTFPSTGASTIVVDVVLPGGNTLASVDQIDFSVAGQFYAQTDPTITTNAFTYVDGIDGFEEDKNAAGSDAVQYVVELRSVAGGASTFKYWDGAAWATADGTYAQSNTFADLNTNIPTLDLSAGFLYRLVVFLHSDDGTSTPDITENVTCYNFFVTQPVPQKVILYGWLKEVDGTGLAGSISVSNQTAVEHTGILLPKSEKTVTTDAEGYWEIEVYETETIGHTYNVTIDYTDDIGKTIKYTEVTIPNQATAALLDLVA